MVGQIKASALFSKKDRNTIKQAIIELERNTSGEIIPIVASTSGRYDRAEDLVGLMLSLLSVSAGWYLFHNNESAASWSSFNFDLTSIISYFPRILIRTFHDFPPSRDLIVQALLFSGGHAKSSQLRVAPLKGDKF